MARRAFVPTIPPPPGTPAPTTRASGGATPSAPPYRPAAAFGHGWNWPRGSACRHDPVRRRLKGSPWRPRPSSSTGLPPRTRGRSSSRGSSPSLSGRTRVGTSSLAVRLLRAYREAWRVDRARELAATLPSSPSSWHPLDTARLAIERAAILATIDARPDHADAELRRASRALQAAPRGAPNHRAARHAPHAARSSRGSDESALSRRPAAARLAEHVAERLEDGAWKVSVSMTLGHLSMVLADPRTAGKHYATALARSPARGDQR